MFNIGNQMFYYSFINYCSPAIHCFAQVFLAAFYFQGGVDNYGEIFKQSLDLLLDESMMCVAWA